MANIHPDLHQVAAAQAKSLSVQSDKAQESLGLEPDTADVLTYLVLSGLAMELYLKAILLLIDNGKVTTGHVLNNLYSKLPIKIQEQLSDSYLSQKPAIYSRIGIQALRHKAGGKSQPEKYQTKNDYGTFQGAIESVSHIFTRARYFFEEITTEDFVYIEWPAGQIQSLIHSLDVIYDCCVEDQKINGKSGL